MWLITLLFALMLIGAIYFLLDQTGKERAEARLKAWEHQKRRALETQDDPDVWPVTKAPSDIFTDSGDGPD